SSILNLHATVERQRQRERAPLPDLTLHPNATAVVLDDLFADWQPQAGALGFLLERVTRLHELLEHLRLILPRDAHARVGDADFNSAVDGAGAADDRTRVGELDRVRQQVNHDLDQAVRVAHDHGHPAWYLHAHCQTLGFAERDRGGDATLD